jgi:hypothetical protein
MIYVCYAMYFIFVSVLLFIVNILFIVQKNIIYLLTGYEGTANLLFLNTQSISILFKIIKLIIFFFFNVQNFKIVTKFQNFKKVQKISKFQKFQRKSKFS